MGASGVVVYLGLGSNQGDSRALLQRGVHELRSQGVVARRCSSLYLGPYVGPGAPQRQYWNAVVEAVTALPPLELLAATRTVERRCGRQTPRHLQPRSLDVDVLFYARWRVLQPRLIVPHPRLGERRFVLEPLDELGVLAALGGTELVARLAQLRACQRLERLPGALSPGDARALAPA